MNAGTAHRGGCDGLCRTFLGVLLVLGAVIPGFAETGAGERAAAIERQLGLATPADAPESAVGLSVAGFTEAKHDVLLGLPEAGRVARVLVKEGARVKAGDTLLYLDKTLQELDARQQRLKRDMQADLDYARQREKILAEQFESAQRLLDAGSVISRDDFLRTQMEYAKATADVVRLETQKTMEKVECAMAEERLNRRILRAPAGGMVVHLFKAEGESIQAHEPLVRLVDSTTGRFVGNTEAAVGRQLRIKQPVCVRIDGPGMKVVRSARVNFVSPVIDTASNLMEVKAEFDNGSAPVQLGGAAVLLPGDADCK